MKDNARYYSQRYTIELKIESIERQLSEARSEGDDSAIRDLEIKLEAAKTELSNLDYSFGY